MVKSYISPTRLVAGTSAFSSPSCFLLPYPPSWFLFLPPATSSCFLPSTFGQYSPPHPHSRLYLHPTHARMLHWQHRKINLDNMSRHSSHRYCPKTFVQRSWVHWWFSMRLRLSCSTSPRRVAASTGAPRVSRLTMRLARAMSLFSYHCGQRHVFHASPQT